MGREQFTHGTVYGYRRRGCRCEQCVEANRLRRRESSARSSVVLGVKRRVDYEATRNHIANVLLKGGMSYEQIANALKVDKTTIHRILRSQITSIDSELEKRTLATQCVSIPPKLTAKSHEVRDTRPRRMVRALVAVGWGRPQLSSALDVSRSVIEKLLRSNDDATVCFVKREIDERITEKFEDLLNNVAGSEEVKQRSIAVAAKRGFITAEHWTPETIGLEGYTPDTVSVGSTTIDTVKVRRAIAMRDIKWADLNHQERVLFVKNTTYTVNQIERGIGGNEDTISRYINEHRYVVK